MKVLLKMPGKVAQIEEIDNTLEALQAAVGGFIECVKLADDAVLICNEEGKIKNLDFNFKLAGNSYRGSVVICGIKGEEFCDIPDALFWGYQIGARTILDLLRVRAEDYDNGLT